MFAAIGLILGILIALFIAFVSFGVFLKYVGDLRADRVARAAYARRNAAITAFIDAHPGATREEAIEATRPSKA